MKLSLKAYKKLKKPKYNSIKTTIDNIVFHSKKEASRYKELKLLENCGLIKDLKLQQVIPIIVKNTHICKYIADFTYLDVEKNKTIIEDVKGFKTQIYNLKKKLVEALYDIKITEI